MFPAVYIPNLNTHVFKHQAITWEWALSVGSIPIFIFGIEAWKFVKRHWGFFNGRVSDRVRKDASLSLRQGFFTDDVAGANRKSSRRMSWSKKKPVTEATEIIEMA